MSNQQGHAEHTRSYDVIGNQAVLVTKFKNDPPLTFTNYYCCPRCEEEWQSKWSCACDDECPECGVSSSPVDYDCPDDEE